MKIKLIFLFLLLCLPLPAEIYLGGSVGTFCDIMPGAVGRDTATVEVTQEMLFFIDVEGESFTLSLEPALVYNWYTGSVQLDLGRGELLWFPAEALTIGLGRFVYAPGTGEVLSATNYFIVTDYAQILSAKPQRARLPAPLLQAKLFLEAFSLTLTAAPFSQPLVIPAPESPWFAHKELPGSIIVPYPVDTVMELADVYVVQETGALPSPRDLSLALETAYQGAWFDASLIFYYGDDNTLLLVGEMDFPHGLFEDFDIYLSPLNARMTALGGNFAANWQALRFWADVSYSFERSFMTNQLSATSFQTLPAESTSLEYVLGVSLEVEAVNLLLLGEYKNMHILKPVERLTPPMLASLASVTASLQLFDYTTLLQGFFLFSPLDFSLVTGFSLGWMPVDELELKLTMPFYLGGEKTLFGQYAKNRLFSLSLTVKY